MSLGRSAAFLLRYILVGLGTALIVLWLFPELVEPPHPVVEVREATPLPVPTDATGPVSYAEAVAQAAPAVVNIHTAKVVTPGRSRLLEDPVFRRFFDQRFRDAPQRLEASLGSGVVVSADGYVLTNHHVIADADQIQVLLATGEAVGAQVVGVDPETDLAVLKIEARTDLPTITIAASGGLEVGDVVLAIGNPFGVGQTVTQGIVSATGRSRLGINTFEDFIQTDAAINPGNSGGALVNAFGELIGINTAIFSKSGGYQGIGFAIPMSLAQGVMTDIIEHGQVIRGWLGIEGQDLDRELADSYALAAADGLLVAGVYRDGPAYRAGIMPGDLILEIDGEVVGSMTALRDLVVAQRPGDQVELRGLRRDQEITWRVQLGKRPVENAPP
jgi:serine protease DegS